ncbi:MAG: aminoacetone oxidase family FAD-binding enzyme, partial [Lachnospiraceae bacterium]|nr:aminoacetone oxidase family FAD-binding enzyme [Lachnospiraceae bacterium]
MTDILIIGGGASGMAAAVRAAEKGASVLILEKKEMTGKKLLSTGNGRCNFSSARLAASDYDTEEPAFAERFLSDFGTEDALSFFGGLGIMAHRRGDGLYPMSMQAKTVRTLLADRVKSLGVSVRTSINVTEIGFDREKGCFSAETASERFTARKLILACGTPAGVRDRDAYTADRMLERTGHRIRPLLPALVPLTGHAGIEKLWDGIRHECTVSYRGEQEAGEVQFTSFGLSGIPVFQISIPAVREIKGKGSAKLVIDFLPDFTEEELCDTLVKM